MIKSIEILILALTTEEQKIPQQCCGAIQSAR